MYDPENSSNFSWLKRAFKYTFRETKHVTEP